jgi:hypothetical protein
MLGGLRLFFIVRSDHLFVSKPVAAKIDAPLLRGEVHCAPRICLSIAKLVLSDDVSLAFKVNHSAHIRWFVSAGHHRGKPIDCQKTIRS